LFTWEQSSCSDSFDIIVNNEIVNRQLETSYTVSDFESAESVVFEVVVINCLCGESSAIIECEAAETDLIFY